MGHGSGFRGDGGIGGKLSREIGTADFDSDAFEAIEDGAGNPSASFTLVNRGKRDAQAPSEIGLVLADKLSYL